MPAPRALGRSGCAGGVSANTRERGAVMLRRRRGTSVRRREGFVVAGVVTTLVLGGVAKADYVPGEPPAVDPGTPVFAGSANPVPAEPVAYDPAKNMMQAI